MGNRRPYHLPLPFAFWILGTGCNLSLCFLLFHMGLPCVLPRGFIWWPRSMMPVPRAESSGNPQVDRSLALTWTEGIWPLGQSLTLSLVGDQG